MAAVIFAVQKTVITHLNGFYFVSITVIFLSIFDNIMHIAAGKVNYCALRQYVIRIIEV